MALNLLADLFVKESLEPGSVHPQGNRSTRGAPHGVYQCAGHQRWCVITCRHDADWEGLIRAMGGPEWAHEPQLRTVAGRMPVDVQDRIDEHISAWTRVRPDREVMEILQAEGVPAGMMMYVSDQPLDPHFRYRGYLLELNQPGLGPILLEGPAFHATGLPGPITLPAPLLGQDTRDIAREVLGYSDDRINELVSTGVLVETKRPRGND
jgi:crotonobetainyl-CoA:carnitine CoA-transferase CaiB-like acyl-CoA transferase